MYIVYIFRQLNISIRSMCETRVCNRTRTISAITLFHGNWGKTFSYNLGTSGSWDGKIEWLQIHVFLPFLFSPGLEKILIFFCVRYVTNYYDHGKLNNFLYSVGRYRKDERYETFCAALLPSYNRCRSPILVLENSQRSTNVFENYLF